MAKAKHVGLTWSRALEPEEDVEGARLRAMVKTRSTMIRNSLVDMARKGKMETLTRRKEQNQPTKMYMA
jgi:hypothetical protein